MPLFQNLMGARKILRNNESRVDVQHAETNDGDVLPIVVQGYGEAGVASEVPTVQRPFQGCTGA
jgi:hypothetical protein